MTKRGSLSLLLSVAVPPWALACLVTFGWSWATGGGDVAAQWLRDLLLTPQLLLPAVVLASAGGVAAVLRRLGRVRADQWWLAGGLFAFVAFCAAGILGLLWGGGYVSLWAMDWVLLSGYLAFVFACGSYVWRKAASQELPRTS